ncbi:MAG: FAD-dependent oxidoreductase, partial [Eubacteriales bacterium]
GVMHRNTYLNSPALLRADYSVREKPEVFFAGQMTGVEGYIESTGSGFVAGVNAARRVLGQEPVIFPQTTMIGAMAHYVSHGGEGDFTPMNANFGIVPLPEKRVKGGKTARNEALAARSLAWIDSYTGRATDTPKDEDGQAELQS